MSVPKAKQKIEAETKTIELQTLEITRPLVSVRSLHNIAVPEKTRPKIVLETFPTPLKQKIEKNAPLAVPSTFYDTLEEERIEWKIALIFSGLAIAAAVLFDLI